MHTGYTSYIKSFDRICMVYYGGSSPKERTYSLATAGLPVTDGFQSIFSLYMATGGQIRVM